MRKGKKTKNTGKSLWLIVILALLAVCALFNNSGNTGTESYNEKLIVVGYSQDELIGIEYTEAEKLLEDSGFENITTSFEITDDAESNDESGTVKKVSIDGETEFSAEDKFESDSEVEITYVKYESETNENQELPGEVDAFDETGTFSVTMLDVGQGLSLLINADGHYMIYDGGGKSRSSYVVSYLKSHGVTTIDMMVASHYDEDHINGLVGILNTTTVKTALIPDYTKDTNIYNSFMNKLDSSGAELIKPLAGDSYTLGNAKIQVISPRYYSSLEDNNNSIVLKITYGKFSMIVTGDAEEEAENTMVSSGYDLDSDLYVVGHHGSSSSTSYSFLNAVSPSYVFISVGEDNSYGHPTKNTMEKLQKCGAEMFRSDVQGEVTLTYSDGKITTSQEPCTDWSYRTYETQESQQTVTKSTEDAATAGNSSNGQTYVLNTHTKKFHYPSCSSVKQIKELNREDVTATRDSLISQGYEPCGNCHP